MVTGQSQQKKSASIKSYLSLFASVKLTIPLLVLLATTVLIGAWCPQEAAVGRDKVVEQFGPQIAEQMIRYGISDIFHSPWFLGLIGLLTVNLVVASVQRVFPKVRTLNHPMPFLGRKEISKLSVFEECPLQFNDLSETELELRKEQLLSEFAAKLKKSGYSVNQTQSRLTGHWGKVGRLAPTITHIGLLLLLTGISITSWTGFGGFQPVDLHGMMSFGQSEHSKLWVGKLPDWRIRVDATRRDDYENGDPKQWYSTLSVVDKSGKVVKTQEISVNNPLSYDGVDIYQSSWGLHELAISFNGHRYQLELQQMGPRVNAAFMPLDRQTIMIFSVRGADKPIRVFAKVPEWRQPRILAVLNKGQTQKLGAVDVKYDELIPTTGLQYKSDPGLPITYTAFGFIMLGVMLAAVPYRQVWVALEPQVDGQLFLAAGGISRKAKNAFAKSLKKYVSQFSEEVNGVTDLAAVYHKPSTGLPAAGNTANSSALTVASAIVESGAEKSMR